MRQSLFSHWENCFCSESRYVLVTLKIFIFKVVRLKQGILRKNGKKFWVGETFLNTFASKWQANFALN